MPDDAERLSELIDGHAALAGQSTDLDLTTWADMARGVKAEDERLRAGLHRIRDLGPGMTREWCVHEADAALYGGEAPKTPGGDGQQEG